MTATFPHAAAKARRSTTSILFGLFLVVAGSLFVASNFGLLPFSPTLLDLTPVLLGIVACDRLAAGRPRAALFWLVAAAALGYWLADGSFHLSRIVKLWPLGLLLFGVVTVARALGWSRGQECPSGRSRGELAIFSTVRSQVDDPAYSGGSCIAVMGGHRLDLRAAQLDEGGAVIQVFAWWGGINIQVPESWSVSTQVFATLGSAEDKTRPAHPLPAGMPRLVVRGVVVMGGLEVHN